MSENYKQRSILEIMNDVLGTIRDYYDSEYVYYIERDEEEILTIYELSLIHIYIDLRRTANRPPFPSRGRREGHAKSNKTIFPCFCTCLLYTSRCV